MPFKSKAQARFMFSQHPKTAKEFAAHTSNMESLPEKALHRAMKRKSRKKGGKTNAKKEKEMHLMNKHTGVRK